MDVEAKLNRIAAKIGLFSAAEERRARIKANKEIERFLRNRLFDSIPLKDMMEILDRHGFDSEAMEGIYTGREGRSHDKVGPNTWLTMTWYKMEVTGRWEIVAYLS